MPCTNGFYASQIVAALKFSYIRLQRVNNGVAAEIRGIRLFDNFDSELTLTSLITDGAPSSSLDLLTDATSAVTTVSFLESLVVGLAPSPVRTIQVYVATNAAQLAVIDDCTLSVPEGPFSIPLRLLVLQVFTLERTYLRRWCGLEGPMVFDAAASGTVFLDSNRTVIVDPSDLSGQVVGALVSNEGRDSNYILPDILNSMTYNRDSEGRPFLDGRFSLLCVMPSKAVTFVNRVFWFVLGRKIWTSTVSYWMRYNPGDSSYPGGSFAFTTGAGLDPTTCAFRVYLGTNGVQNIMSDLGTIPSQTARTLWMVQIAQEGTSVVVRVRATGMDATRKATYSNTTFPDVRHTRSNFGNSTNMQLYKYVLHDRYLDDAGFEALWNEKSVTELA